MVSAYVGEAAPIGSATLSHLLPVKLSSASIRNTLAELTQLGLAEQPHPSSGRIPSERGLRLFVDQLLDRDDLGAYERRSIAVSVDEADEDAVMHVTSQLLSECTHQLGFVVTPRIDRIVLQHVSLVRLSSERVLVVLVSQAGATHRDRLLARAVDFGTRMLSPEDGAVDLVIETRVALLEQPEFNDPRRIRDLFSAVETKERLLEVLDQMLGDDGVCVAFGQEVDEPSLHDCALVATRYGAGRGGNSAPLGTLGVIGPTRMNYRRVIPLVEYLSQVITEKLQA